jgi:hypothetical protein
MVAMKCLLGSCLALATMSVGGCKKADDGTGLGTDGAVTTTADPDAYIAETTTNVSMDVTADTTWSGLVKVHSSIAIAPGVTLTIAPGTLITLDATVAITVNGTVLVNGSKGKVVTLQPAAGTHFWNAWEVPTGGTLTLAYVQQTGGGITVSGGTVTARDSEFSNVTHDLLVVSSGTIDFQYSWIGVAEGQPDTTHCDMHFDGGSPTITVSHSNLSTAAYGVMFYAGQGADFTHDNWFGNTADMSKIGPTTGDISYSYFKGGTPAVSGLTATNMAATMVPDTGPR